MSREDEMPVLLKEQQISSELLVYVSATKLDFESGTRDSFCSK